MSSESHYCIIWLILGGVLLGSIYSIGPVFPTLPLNDSTHTEHLMPFPPDSLGTWKRNELPVAPQLHDLHCDEHGTNCSRTIWAPEVSSVNTSHAQGILVASLALTEVHGKRAMTLYLSLQNGFNMRAVDTVLHFGGLVPNEDSYWLALGSPAAVSSPLRHKVSSNKSALQKLMAKKKNGIANKSETLELFVLLYRVQISASRRNQTLLDYGFTYGNISKKDVAKDVHRFYRIYRKSCVWLLNLSMGQTTLSGRMWSTCGEEVSFETNNQMFASGMHKINTMAVFLFFAQALFFGNGIVDQMEWIYNSRGRSRRVNPFQLLSLFVFSSFNIHVVSTLSILLSYSVRALCLLRTVFFVDHLLLVVLFLDVDQSRLPTTSDGAAVVTFRRFVKLYLCSWIGSLLGVFLDESIFDPIVLVTFSLLFWAPQFIHGFSTADGFIGLTGPFLTSASLQAILPMIIAATVELKPWLVSTPSRIGLFVGVSIIMIETAVLYLFRLTEGRRILPGWLAPWRHRYTASMKRMLREVPEHDGMCAICREQLADAQDTVDEIWRTPCSHYYHASCLQNWMKERMMCPLCREVIPEP